MNTISSELKKLHLLAEALEREPEKRCAIPVRACVLAPAQNSQRAARARLKILPVGPQSVSPVGTAQGGVAHQTEKLYRYPPPARAVRWASMFGCAAWWKGGCKRVGAPITCGQHITAWLLGSPTIMF